MPTEWIIAGIAGPVLAIALLSWFLYYETKKRKAAEESVRFHIFQTKSYRTIAEARLKRLKEKDEQIRKLRKYLPPHVIFDELFSRPEDGRY
jgi:hypothetical protein